jgi:hypothetical protein
MSKSPTASQADFLDWKNAAERVFLQNVLPRQNNGKTVPANKHRSRLIGMSQLRKQWTTDSHLLRRLARVPWSFLELLVI